MVTSSWTLTTKIENRMITVTQSSTKMVEFWIEFAGEKYTSNGHFALGLKLSLIWKAGVRQTRWVLLWVRQKRRVRIKAGRFEAYDMFFGRPRCFPWVFRWYFKMNFIRAAALMQFQTKEARGRGSDGQLMYSQSFGDSGLKRERWSAIAWLVLWIATMQGGRPR